MIDLHIHTTASDGLFTLPEILEKARAANVTTLAITDHDTVSGIIDYEKEFLASENPRCIPGIELSVNYPEKKEDVHVLGYFLDYKNPDFSRELVQIKAQRSTRNEEIIQRLNELGMPMTLEEAQIESGKDLIGRPHIARVMINKGYVKDFQEAFDVYLGTEGKAFVPKKTLNLQEGITFLKKYNALVVIAHPWYISNDPEVLDAFFAKYAPYGIDGMEVYYPHFSESFKTQLLKICEKYNLTATGGSDYHGYPDHKVDLGTGDGTVCVPRSTYQALLARRKSAGIGE